tara:strand:- start:574 stop:957 length:384 start_codon:yes stop_codon:yes gene_type:complete
MSDRGVYTWKAISTTNNRLDVVKYLGREAVGLRLRVPTGETGTVKLKLNSLEKRIKVSETGPDTTIDIWLDSTAAPGPSMTVAAGESIGAGSGVYEGLKIHSIECELFVPETSESSSLETHANIEVW